MNFQTSILILAGVLLLVGAIIIGYAIRNTIRSKTWPTYIANCPDYWTDQAGDGSQCVSHDANAGTGALCSGTVNFSQYASCDKYNISNTCGIYWDGINYGNQTLQKQCAPY